MNELGFIDYLVIATIAVLSWRLYQATLPPSSSAEDGLGPMLAVGLAPMPWREPVLPPGVAPGLRETLRRICLASGYSGFETFLDGAKLTYEAVIQDFARGDLSGQTNLMSKVVRDTFSEAIAAREARGETVGLTFVGFAAVDIVDAELSGGRAFIDVRFAGDMVSVTRDRDGRLVAGDPGRVVTVTEIWTFERELRSASPNWLLTATGPDE
jgi:predicted lipid-binding transport protein (Tim44 family)